MHRSHLNLVPVTNKYLAQKQFERVREINKIHLQNVHGSLDLSPPTARKHCFDRTRQKLMRKYEQEIIEHENQRLQSRMSTSSPHIDSRNDYAPHSLNIAKRQRDEAQHKVEVERLQKQITHARTNYPAREFHDDFAKQQNFKRRISRYPSNIK